MVLPSQQHVAPYVNGVEWRFGTRGLRILAAFWAGIPVKVTQEAGVVPRCRRAAIRTVFQSPGHAGIRLAYSTLHPQGRLDQNEF